MLQSVAEEEEEEEEEEGCVVGEAVQGKAKERSRRLTLGEFCVFAAELHCQSFPYTQSHRRKHRHQDDRSDVMVLYLSTVVM